MAIDADLGNTDRPSAPVEERSTAVAEATRYAEFPSPIGDLLITVNSEGALTRVHYAPYDIAPEWTADEAACGEVLAQLQAYFGHERTVFDLPLAPAGTSFQQQVWQALQGIPYGRTVSYGHIAKQLGDAGASRAVGLANGQNPIAIVVPCHRVIGANGALTGYGGGLPRKEWLLRHERARSQPTLF